MAEKFSFRYVMSPTGSLSGESLITQTQDVINDVGAAMQISADDSAQARATADAALVVAHAAQTAANEVNNLAANALSKVTTVEGTLSLHDQRISINEQNVASALSTAKNAQSASEQAVAAANIAQTRSTSAQADALSAKNVAETANTKSNSALRMSEEAKETAAEAKTLASDASIHADEVREEISQFAAQAKKSATAAAGSASSAGASATAAGSASDLAKDWATKTGEPVEAAESEGSDDLYSARQYSINAAAAATSAAESSEQAQLAEQSAASSKLVATDQAKLAGSHAQSAAALASAASNSADLSMDWATKMDTYVEPASGEEEALYSSRWYATEAKKSADEALSASAGANYPLSYKPQPLAEEDKAQARANIDAVSKAELETRLSGLSIIVNTDGSVSVAYEENEQ